jgi:hypothetical protein
LCQQEVHDKIYSKWEKELEGTRDSSKFRFIDCMRKHIEDERAVIACARKTEAEMRQDNIALVGFFKANYAKYC